MCSITTKSIVKQAYIIATGNSINIKYIRFKKVIISYKV